MPIGFRRELSGVRHHELLLARDRAILQDLELEISHQLGDAIRDIDLNYGLTQTNFNRRVAAEAEVHAVEAAVRSSSNVTLDLLLDAQRRRAEAESRLLPVACRLQPGYNERPLPQGLAARLRRRVPGGRPVAGQGVLRRHAAGPQARRRLVHGLRLHAAERREPRAGPSKVARRLRNGSTRRDVRWHASARDADAGGRGRRKYCRSPDDAQPAESRRRANSSSQHVARHE